MLNHPYYLCYCAVLAGFRSCMYILFPTQVAKVKISEIEWKKESVREVADAWISVIRLLNICRCVVCAWGSTLDIEERTALGYMNVVLDCWFMYKIIQMCVIKNTGAIVHRNPTAPLILQTSGLIAAVLSLYA